MAGSKDHWESGLFRLRATAANTTAVGLGLGGTGSKEVHGATKHDEHHAPPEVQVEGQLASGGLAAEEPPCDEDGAKDKEEQADRFTDVHESSWLGREGLPEVPV